MASKEPDRRNNKAVDRKFSDENTSLLFRTRGNSEPYGKPRVYLACHPADLPIYLDEIAEDIFRSQNCVIMWRDPAQSDAGEPQDPQGSQPQDPQGSQPQDPQDSQPQGHPQGLPEARIALVVFPVTLRLLTEPNTAMDIEFQQALARHIPVLPLMMEDGIYTQFREKFGTLQYLKKNTQDETVISYDIKLEKFLKRTLMGDKEAEQIRGAFAAHVFLSYRKKDRSKAQDLMRLVHKREKFRDVAIWYDEYLVPGESFSASIDKILHDCDLFLLAVTPNLVNEKNYVMEVEYPNAVRYKRKVLAAETAPMSEGETARLFVWFPGIPDPAATPEQIYDLLEGLPSRLPGPDGRQHDLLIGLAYLKGIDIEVDHERALGLIRSAADRGLTDAMRRLGEMYSSGEGVGRDFDQSIYWFKALVEVLRRPENSAADGQKLFHALRRLEEAYRDDSKPDEAERTCREALEIARGSTGSWAVGATADALLDLGYYAYERKDLAEAERYYGQAAVLYSREGMEPELGIVYERQSLLARKRGDHRTAARHLEKALQIRQKRAAANGADSHNRTALALTCVLMGDLVRKEDEDAARIWYDRALDMYRVLAEETHSPSARDGLAVTLCAMAETSGEKEARDGYWREALDILTQLYKDTGREVYRTKMSICEINLKGVQSFIEEYLAKTPEEKAPSSEELEAGAQERLDAGDYAGAAGLMEQEYKILRKAVYDEHHDTWEDRLRMYTYALRAGRAYGKAGMREKAEECLGMIRRYARPEENQDGRFFIAEGNANETTCGNAGGNTGVTADVNAGGNTDKTADATGHKLRSICAEACLLLAEFSTDPETAEAMLDECLQELHRIYEKEPGADSLLDLAEGYRLAGMNPLTEDAEIYTEEAKRFCGIGLTGYPGDGRFTILTNEIREG